MPPIDRPFGNDTLIVPCYLATTDDDPGLIAWKREHPDWFVAGTWTRPHRRPGQPSTDRRAHTVAWMNETRDQDREQSKPGGRLDPNWAQAALRLATLPIGLASAEMHDGVGAHVEKAAAKKPESLPFLDDQGHPVITPAGPRQGQPMQLPAGFDPYLFVARGLAARRRLEEFGQASDNGGGYLAALALDLPALKHFGQGRSWDAQRFQGDTQDEWVDYATVAIGLYAAAAGLSREEILRIEDLYALLKSVYTNSTTGRKPDMDTAYSHLPTRNVENTLLGFQLYDSGRVGSIAAPQTR